MPQQRLKLEDITTISLDGYPQTIPELAITLSDRVGTRWWQTLLDRSAAARVAILPQLRLNSAEAESIALDLATLDGHPPRIGLILCDRIQKARNAKATHV